MSDCVIAEGGSGTEPSGEEPGAVLKLNLKREERDGVEDAVGKY